MTANNSQYTERGSETREDLLRVPELWNFFCERTLNDARRAVGHEGNAPSLGIILVCAVVAVFFIALGQYIIFYVMGTLTAVQLLWFLIAKAGNSKISQQKTISNIRNGHFPAEIREFLIKRLRWWNYLIVPSEWTPGSHLFDVAKNLETRRAEIADELKFWQSDEGRKKNEEIAKLEQEANERKQEQNKKLLYLQTRGVHVTAMNEGNAQTADKAAEMFDDAEKLTRKIHTPEQLNSHLERIAAIADQQTRLYQEQVLIDALLFKVKKIQDLLDNVSKLHPALENINADNLDDSTRQAIDILERRRQLVAALNRINHNDVMKLFSFDVNYIKDRNAPTGL